MTINLEHDKEQILVNFGELYDPETGEACTMDNPNAGKYCPFHEDQIDILQANKRFCCACAGTGGGKTVVGAYWAVFQIQKAIQKFGKCTGMIIAPTYKVLSRATMPTFIDACKYTEFEGNYKKGTGYFESKSKFVLPNNWGNIWCQGADNPGGLEGGQFDFVWFDEGGQGKKATFEAITGRTGAKQGPILVTTTPYGLGSLYNDWYAQYIAGNSDYYFRIWDSIKNPAYPQEEFERAKARLSPEKFEERYRGKFMRLEGLVYPTFHRCRISMTTDEVLQMIASREGRLFGGMDFGWNDPFAAIIGFLDYETDVLTCFWERYRSQTPMEEHADALPKEIQGKKITWAADSSRPDFIRKLKKGGHNVRKAKKHYKGTSVSAIINGIMMMGSRIHSNRLKVCENFCTATCAESEVYRYPEKDEEIVGDKPIDIDNHCMDALRYMITEIDWKKAA